VFFGDVKIFLPAIRCGKENCCSPKTLRFRGISAQQGPFYGKLALADAFTYHFRGSVSRFVRKANAFTIECPLSQIIFTYLFDG
jgi:hypothetical protein